MDNASSYQSSYSQNLENAFNALETDASDCGLPMPAALRLLADASKTDVGVRQRLGSSRSLKRLDSLIQQAVLDEADALIDPALRCVGNSCADNDDARATMTDIGFQWAKACLHDPVQSEYLKTLTAKALYNVCADYEQAQQACYRQGVHCDLLQLCCSPSIQGNQDISVIVDLMFWLGGQKAAIEPQLESTLPHGILVALLELPKTYAQHPDVEVFASLIETMLVFLRDTKVQTQWIEFKMLDVTIEVLQAVETRICSLDKESEEYTEDLHLLKPLSASLTWCLSDLAAKPEFANAYPLECSSIVELQSFINASAAAADVKQAVEQNRATLAAYCQIVGNLLWTVTNEQHSISQDTCRLYIACFSLLIQSPADSSSNMELLHALAGLLLQLTRQSGDLRRAMTEDKNCQAGLERLCQHDVDHIKQDGVRLIRGLCKDSADSQALFGQLAVDTLRSLKESGQPGVPGVEQNS